MIFRKATLLLLFFSLFVAVSQTQAQPTITTMTLQNLNPTNDPFLTWRITFSEPVTGVSTSNFSLSPTGTVAATLDSVTSAPGNSTWFVHASGVSGDGTLGASLDDPNGINGSSGALSEVIVGPAYTVDNTDPQVVSINRLDPSPTGASTVNFEITFSEPVVNVSSVNFAPAGTLTGTVGNITNVDGVTWTASISGISGSGTIRLDLYDTSNITDLAGNWLFSDFSAGESYIIDQTPAELLCISTVDTNPTSATSVQYRVEFDDPVSSVTAANFSVLTTGNATGTIADVSPETVGNTLDTVWIVTVDTISGDGTVALELTDPTNIRDEFGNETTSTGTGCPDQNVYTIDNTGPALACITRTDPSPTSADTVSYAIGFEEPVTGVSAANFTATGSGTVAFTTVNVTPASNTLATTWTVTVSGITGDGDLTLTYQSPNLVLDETGNPGTSTTPTTCNDNIYIIDNQLPVIGACLELVEPFITPDLTSGTSVQFRVVFNEPVQGLTPGNFALGTLTNITSAPVISDVSPGSPADPAVDLDEEWIVTVTNVNVVTTTTVENGLLELIFDNADNITDEAGNSISGFSQCAASYTVDQRAPTITCIERYPETSATLTSASLVQFLVTFREPVTNINPADFAPIYTPTTGSLSATVTAVDAGTSPSDSATTYIVTVSNITGTGSNSYDRLTSALDPAGTSLGNGELRLGLSSTVDITDIAGNPIDPLNVDALCNEWYLVDQVLPEVSSITMETSACLTSGSFTVTFTEDVRALQPEDLNVIWSGSDCSTTPVIDSITPADWSNEFTVTIVSTSTLELHQIGPGYLALEVISPSTIYDAAINPLANAPFQSDSYFICRCFEPAVVTSPDAVTTSGFTYPEPPPQFDQPESTTCTAFGEIQLPFGDTPTTSTTPDFIRWNATEWDCGTSTPFAVYLDGNLLGITDGNTTPGAQSPIGTSNNICSPIGEDFFFPFPDPLEPGLHTINIDINGDCTSGTTYYFNVLDPPVLVFPIDDFATCRSPRGFAWEPVEGAIGYDIYLRDLNNSYGELYARTTGPLTIAEITGLSLPPANYEWYVVAYNEYGHSTSERSSFEVTVDDVDTPRLYTTNGTIYDIHVTPSTTYIAGDFTLVRDANGWQSQAAIAAINNVTSTVVTSFSPAVNNTVYDIEPYQDSLLIGGRFTNVNGDQLARMARLDLSNGDSVTTSLIGKANGPIYKIAVHGDIAYFGGDFDRIDETFYNFGTPGDPASNLAYLDLETTGTTSTSLASPLSPNAPVRDLLVDSNDDILYIAGEFTRIGGQPIHALARAPLPLGSTVDPAFNIDIEADVSHYVYDLHKVGNTLYMGGSFTSVQDDDRRNAASVIIGDASTTAVLTQWNPSPNSAVYTLDSVAPGAPIYMGGTFTTVRAGEDLRERAAYLVGVDPILGLPITCSFNVDRVIYTLQALISGRTGTSNIYAGGLATTTGASQSAP